MYRDKYAEDIAKCGGFYYSGINKMERINWKVCLNNCIVQGEKNTLLAVGFSIVYLSFVYNGLNVIFLCVSVSLWRI